MAKRKKFTGAYIRGGRNTLYLTREDMVKALQYVLAGGYDLREMLAEAHTEIHADKMESAMERSMEYRCG